MKKDGRNGESNMLIYRHRWWQQSRWIKASKDRGPEISRKANSECSKSPRSNDQDNPTLMREWIVQALKASFTGKCFTSPRAVILENGRSLPRKDGPEGEATYLKLSLPPC